MHLHVFLQITVSCLALSSGGKEGMKVRTSLIRFHATVQVSWPAPCSLIRNRSTLPSQQDSTPTHRQGLPTTQATESYQTLHGLLFRTLGPLMRPPSLAWPWHDPDSVEQLARKCQAAHVQVPDASALLRIREDGAGLGTWEGHAHTAGDGGPS